MGISAAEIHASLSNNRLHLILMPTEACNFRCTYCYETFEHGRMLPSVVRGVKRFLARRAHELDALEISWFGGEPLLARDIMEDVLIHVGELRRRWPRLRFESDVTTNAHGLSHDVFVRLLQLGVRRYQISIDGPRACHDETRVRPGGGGTFDRIWQNVMALPESGEDYEVLIRLHVHRSNWASLPEFIAEYARTLGRDGRFRLLLRALSPLGGPNDGGFPYLRGEELQSALEALERCALAHGIEPLLAHRLQPVCYAARGNSFVVRADGRLNKCTVALEHPSNQVGRLDERGNVRLAAARMRLWMRGLWSGDPEELACPKREYVDSEARPRAGALLRQRLDGNRAAVPAGGRVAVRLR